METPVRAHVFVSGTVHRVGFRLAAWDRAKQWGVAGWVEEIPDGRVEAVFEGSQELVQAIIRWCYRGSPDAIVKNVTVEYEKPEGLKEFIIRRSSPGNVSASPANLSAKTINVLIIISGLNGNVKDCDRFWESVKKSHNLSMRLDDIITVNWQQLANPEEYDLSQKINLAQSFIIENLHTASKQTTDSSQHPWWRFLGNPLHKSFFASGLGELLYYNSPDGITVKMGVYRQILEELEKQRIAIEKDLNNKEISIKVRLHIIAEALGASVSHDFLHGLFSATATRIENHPEAEPESESPEKEIVEYYQFWRQAAKAKRIELGSIVTINSQIPLLMLGSGEAVDTLAQGETMLVDEIGMSQNEQEIVWRAFCDRDLLLSFPVSPLFGNHPGIQDIELDGGGSIWLSEKICDRVAELLDRRVV